MNHNLRLLVIVFFVFTQSYSINAQRLWGDRGLCVTAPFNKSHTLIRSNPDGDVSFITTGNDLNGDRRIALQLLDSIGAPHFYPEPLFLSAVSGRPQTVNDHEGGFYLGFNDFNPVSGKKEIRVQRYDRDLNEMWIPGGVFTGLTDPEYDRPKLFACKDGSLFFIAHTKWTNKEKKEAIIQIYNQHGVRSDDSSTSGIHIWRNIDYIKTCEAGDNGMWFVNPEYSRWKRSLTYNHLKSDGNILFNEHRILDLTRYIDKYDDLKSVRIVPIYNGGFVVISSNLVIYTTRDGNQKWSMEDCVLDTSLGYVFQIIPDPETPSCYVFMNKYIDGLEFSVVKLSLKDKPEISWKRQLTLYPENMELRVDHYKNKYGKGCFDGEFLYYSNRYTLWKLDRDGNHIFGPEGTQFLRRFNPFDLRVRDLSMTKSGKLMLRGTRNGQDIVMHIDPTGKLIWSNSFYNLFSDRRKYNFTIGLTQLDDSTLRVAKTGYEGISIQDVTFDGKLSSSINDRLVVDYKNYPKRGLTRADAIASGKQFVFVTNENSATKIGSSRIQFCDAELNLYPEKRAYPSGGDYPDIPFTDHNGGWWLYGRVWVDPTLNYAVNHIDEESNRWKDGNLFIFEGIEANHSSYYNLDVYDGNKGHWFMTFDSDSNLWAQKVYKDRTVQFEDGPVSIPIKWQDSNDRIAASADGSLFYIKEIKGLERNYFNYEVYNFNDNLELVWNEPVKIFKEPVWGNPGSKEWASVGHFETAIGRSDNSLWFLERIKHRHQEYSKGYIENRLQLISSNGDKMLSEQGLTLSKEKTNSNMTKESTIFPDHQNGIWVVWDDYTTNRVKATYISSDLQFPEPYSNVHGIDVVTSDQSRLAEIPPYLFDDNTLIVPLYRDDGNALIMQRLTVEP